MARPKRCSFCGHTKQDWQVDVLIAARPSTHAYICDKCVEHCVLTLKHHKLSHQIEQLKQQQEELT
jgi:ATP-dependent protease Clp ATPase subunit